MKLHNNPTLFRQAIQATAQMMGIREVYVEKDYWVTLVLEAIFTAEAKDYVVFKGGTSLSKCFGVIERFSEDIDLVISYDEAESDNSKNKKLRAVSNIVSGILEEIDVDGVTVKRGMNRKTCHSYPKTLKGDFGQVRDYIVIEATWLGYFEPKTEVQIESYIAQMMKARQQDALIAEYEMSPFVVNALCLERTFCEKIMSLIRFSYGADPIQDLKMKIRHTYDIHMLLQREEILQFLHSEQFREMMLKVREDDKRSYRNNNEWLEHPFEEALIFSDTVTAWSKLIDTYEHEFMGLVYGQPVDEQNVMLSLLVIANRLKEI